MKIPLCLECGSIWNDKRPARRVCPNCRDCNNLSVILDQVAVEGSRKILDRRSKMAWSYTYISLLGCLALAKREKGKNWQAGIHLDTSDTTLEIEGDGVVWMDHLDGTRTKLEDLIKNDMPISEMVDVLWALRGGFEHRRLNEDIPL